MEFPIRINKYLRDKGYASRREADELVSAGKVLVNGKFAKPGLLINENDKVILKGGNEKKYIYLAYYKPYGLATQGLKNQESVITQWQSKGIFPIGRLDKDSEGLLILTNDGRITSKILGEEEKYEKEYIVKVREKLRQGVPAIFQKGMKTDIGDLLPAEAEIIDNHTLSIILHEGKRHQIRVMLGELGYTVSMLKRIRVGHIKLGNLNPGETRELAKKEFELFF
ncbi:MAG: pseudouridine synthase [Patescibacteria group bacterium]